MNDYLIAYTGPRGGTWKYALIKAGTASKAIDYFVDHHPNTFVKEVHEPVEWREEGENTPRLVQFVVAYNGPRNGKSQYRTATGRSAAKAAERFLNSTDKTYIQQVYAPTPWRD